MSDVRALSVQLERQTGYDSIPTIERVYSKSDTGAYECCWPECEVSRRDPEVLWRHVHFGPHKRSFGVADPSQVVVDQ